jgi:hypothetical protein
LDTSEIILSEFDAINDRAGFRLARKSSSQVDIQDLIVPGTVAFRSDDPMKVGQTYPVFVEVSATLASNLLNERVQNDTKKARGEYDGKINPPRTIKIEPIKMTSRMIAQLKGKADEFQITPVTPEQQNTTAEEVTTWKWNVRPLKSGKGRTLDLTLSGIIGNPGSPHAFEPLYHHTINVDEASFIERAKDFWANNWQWFWTALIVPIGAWVWKRWRKKKKKK